MLKDFLTIALRCQTEKYWIDSSERKLLQKEI